MRRGSFVDAGGARIHYRVWPAATGPRAVMVIAHGIAEHSGRYTVTAEAFAEAGFEVWADDHRGHGESGRELFGDNRVRLGEPGPGGMRGSVNSVEEFLDLVRAERPGLPVVVLAHSWGSLMYQIIFNRSPHKIDALILTGTAYRHPLYMDSGQLNRKHKHLGDTGLEWLSRDPQVAPAWLADELASPRNMMQLYGFAEAARLLGRPARNLPPDIPVLIAVGSDDTLGGERSARKLAEAYLRRSGLRDVTVFVYPGARHEILNETNQAEVRSDILAWVNERLASARP